MNDTFRTKALLEQGSNVSLYKVSELAKRGGMIAARLPKLPYALKVLLENLLRWEDGEVVTAGDIEALASVDVKKIPEREIAFTPARVLMQDFTGVPAVVDLAAMRDAVAKAGGDAKAVNPLQPVELVIDHSVQVDYFGTKDAFAQNSHLEFERNKERYAFLRWGQQAFRNFRVVPPETGIVHQVNLESLARVVMNAGNVAFFDTVVGTDSHTTMINGLGVLGWGVGGIEAEAAMLGQPSTMLIPEVIGVRLRGVLREGSTATDLVLRVTELLRRRGVVGKFVEFFGPGVATLPLADRATIANMAPEYGATCGLFPVDAETLRYLRFTGRKESQVKLVEAYYKAQGMFASASDPEPEYTDIVELDLAGVEPSLAGPKRPQDRVALGDVKKNFEDALPAILASSKKQSSHASASAPALTPAEPGAERAPIQHGSVVIAAITSCTNTSNPSVMMAAGLLAKKAVARGLQSKPWVKTSLAPGSKVVTDYLHRARLAEPLEQLNFHLVGYGCTTCIGNSGPLPEPVARAIDEGNLVAAAVLSGNRNFEGRVHPLVRANYLASPPLVVAYALAGRVDADIVNDPIGTGSDGKPVYLRELWPSQKEVDEAVSNCVKAEMFERNYGDVFAGDEGWRALAIPEGDTYRWDSASTYVKNPPYFEGFQRQASKPADISGARILALFGDSITTDHISPAGNIKADSPAGKYLQSHGVKPDEFNSYGARRGNHEVMMRGTFANVRIKNLMVPGVEGGVTVWRGAPDGANAKNGESNNSDGERMPIFDAAMRYQQSKTPLVVVAGKEYGSGSSRDWAAKGPALLGVRVVIAESYERIHRSNLVGMGVLPLEFLAGENAQTHNFDGSEILDIAGLADGIETGFKSGRQLAVLVHKSDGSMRMITTRVRIDTPREVEYFRHGGILPYVVRELLRGPRR